MIYFENTSKEAVFYFAAEEYIMRDIKPAGPVYMLWQTDDTVMVGANQIIDIEIDKEYAHSEGIEIVRRSSGGGTIFTDSGTLLFTVILPYGEHIDPKEVVKEYFSVPVIEAISKFGICAKLEGRNDIQIGDKKISGIAQYVKYGYLCTHGSLLFDADLGKLSRVLTVDKEKITSKALRSVGSRVANIADHIDKNDISAFKTVLIEQCHSEQKEFTENDISFIHCIMNEKYRSQDWTFGNNPSFSIHNAYRFPVGSIEVYLDVEDGCIENCRISGDFLSLKPVSEIEDLIKGSHFERDSLLAALSQIELIEYFGAITYEELLDLILGKDINNGGLIK